MDERLQHLLMTAAVEVGVLAPAKASLFRYVKLANENSWSLLEETILHNRLKLSLAASFNDPFEANPHIVNDLTLEEIYDFLNFALKLEFKEKVPFTFKDGKIFDERGSLLTVEQVESIATKGALQTLPEIFRETKVASFCKRISSQLLWAHYADGYKGIAYHFITSGEPNSAFRHARSIRYTRQRPIVSLSELVETTPFSSKNTKAQKMVLITLILDRFFRQKSIDWAYEEEFRIIAFGKNALDTFIPKELVSIILGPLFPKDDEKRLFDMIKKRERLLRVYRSELSKTDYSVGVDWDSPILIE